MSLRRFSSATSTPTPDVLHAGEHPDERDLDVVVQRAETLRVERRRERLDEPGDRERAPAGRRARATPRRRRGRAAARRSPAPAPIGQLECRRSAGAGRRAGSATRPGRAGTRRASCRGAASRRSASSWPSSARMSGFAPCAAIGRPPVTDERCAARRAPSASSSSVARDPARLGRRRRRPRTRDRRAGCDPRRRPTPPSTASGVVLARSCRQERDGRLRPSPISVTSASSTSAADAPARRRLAERLGQPLVQRAELEEVEELAHLFAVEGLEAQAVGRRSRAGRRAAAPSRRRCWRTWASCSARFARSLGVCSSRCS